VWKVSAHPLAVLEAREARLWYAERSPVAAESFMTELDAAIEMISEAPDRWPEVANGRRRYVMRRFPFILVFRIQSDEIRLLAIQHGRRRPGYWKSRE
jgi:plasmid stabilization system protein ParE